MLPIFTNSNQEIMALIKRIELNWSQSDIRSPCSFQHHLTSAVLSNSNLSRQHPYHMSVGDHYHICSLEVLHFVSIMIPPEKKNSTRDFLRQKCQILGEHRIIIQTEKDPSFHIVKGLLLTIC